MSLVTQVLTASSAAALVIGAWLALRAWLVSRRPCIRWRIDVDDALMPHGPEKFPGSYPRVIFGSTEVRQAFDPSVVVIRLEHSAVKRRDLAGPLVFTFPGREVLMAKIDAAFQRLPADASALDWGPSGGQEVVVREEFLISNNELRLVVLLSGPGQGVHARGPVFGGMVIQERSTPFRPRRRLAFAVTEAVLLCLAIGLPLAPAFFGKPVHLIHASDSWGWPVFVAFMSLVLGAAGFAVGRVLPRDYSFPPPTPASGWRALGRGYLDVVAVPWLRPSPWGPTPESAEPNLAAELRAVLTQLGADDV